MRSGLSDPPPPGWSTPLVAGEEPLATTEIGSLAARAMVVGAVPAGAAATAALRAIAAVMRPVFTEWSGSGPAAGVEWSVVATVRTIGARGT